MKRSYDFAKSQEPPAKKSNALPELIVENFDLEQIWQQIELQNEEVLDKNILHISKVLSSKNLLFKEYEIAVDEPAIEENVDAAAEPVEENATDSESDDIEMQSDSSESETDKSNANEKKHRKSIVDDDFFKLQEMEEFLNKEEAALNQNNLKKTDNDSDSEESVDLFKTNVSDEENEIDRTKNPRYKDFFGSNDQEQKPPKRNKFLEENVSDSENEQLKSTLELREERLKRKIENLEEQAVSEKPWQLKGEITGDKRPQNSLLQEIVDFDLTARPGMFN